MQISTETKFPIPTPSSDRKAQRAANLALSLAKQLSTGEYIQQGNKIPSFYVKVDAWDRSLNIENFKANRDNKVEISNGLSVTINDEDLNGVFDGKNKFRLILLAENGFSSFTIKP